VALGGVSGAAGGALHILALNGGSSSLKYAAFVAPPLADAAAHGEPRPLLRGEVERTSDVAAAVPRVWQELAAAGVAPDAVGHRVVHGGPHHLEPARVDEALIASLRAATPFAPLHLPGALALIAAVATHAPDVPQFVCFDTAFFAPLPPLARRLPIARELDAAGIHRYGFHGLSYESIVRQLGDAVRGRVVVAHLGNGASMAALLDGSPVDTTMGLTPSGGLVMGTRTGDLDPGVVLHLARERGLDTAALEALLDHQSGLLALSGTTSDMQALLAARGGDPRAALAVDAFCWSARKWVGAMAASLGGIDALVFTGGIGEHATAVRAGICDGLAHLGVELDAARNAASAPVIHREGARVVVRVLRTDEEMSVARHTVALLAS